MQFLNKKCNKSIENWGKYLRKVKQQWDKSIYKGQQICTLNSKICNFVYIKSQKNF